MKNVLTLGILGPQFLFVFLGHSIHDKAQLITIVDGQFLASDLEEGFEDVVDDPVPEIGGRITVVILGGYVYDKLGANFTVADALDPLDLNPPFNVGVLKVIDGKTGHQ